MRYDAADSFHADYKRPTEQERRRFREAVRRLNEAYERPVPVGPASLRVRAIQGARGIWEMTWSFAGPDGRATFELTTVSGEVAIRWRRIGDHRIFERP